MKVEIKDLEEDIRRIVKEEMMTQSREMEQSLRKEVRDECNKFAFNRGDLWSKYEEDALKREWIKLIGVIARRHKRSFSGITSHYCKLRERGWNPYH